MAIRETDTAALERDNLFQLNVLLWSTLPQPSVAPMTPVLLHKGFRLRAIEQPLDADVMQQRRLGRCSIDIRPNPVVDVMLESDTNNQPLCILLECKSGSFGIDSNSAPQARGLIVAGGSIETRGFTEYGSFAELCYLVPQVDAAAMDTTLSSLAEQIREEGLPVCTSASLGLRVTSEGVYLATGSPQSSAHIAFEFRSAQRVIEVRPDEDPRPLYLIPWVPDGTVTDDSVLREKIWQELALWIAHLPLSGGELAFGTLLEGVSRGAYGYWRNRESLRGHVWPKVRVIVEALLTSEDVTVGQHSLTVRLISESHREHLLETMRVAQVPEPLPPGVQISLDEHLDRAK